MFAINHAATALLIKKRFQEVHIAWILVSVQLIEFVWVALNYLGIERTTTDAQVRSVANIHLTYMPFSHSIGVTLAIALVAYLALRFGAKKKMIALAVGIGIISHILLDLLVHAPDIAIAPFVHSLPELGSGLYTSAPLVAFVIEFLYGICCWWIYKGSWGLLGVIVLFNLSNITLFIPQVIGLEGFLVGKPNMIVTLIFGQIVVTLLLVGLLSKRKQITTS